MKWSNIRLIFLREVRDQLRDRRTLFTIAVLPLLLYPLLGMSLFRVSQFLKEHPTRVWLIGTSGLPNEPALLEDGAFNAEFCPPSESRLIELTINERLKKNIRVSTPGQKSAPGDFRPATTLSGLAQQKMKADNYDVVVYFPPDFADKLQEFQARLRLGERASPDEFEVPRPQIFVNSADEKSRIAKNRIDDVLDRWRESIIRQNLEQNRIPHVATEPFKVVDNDVAEDDMRRAALWSKILPFVVLIWALTGAFYPAIDLCAGEKERGTLETLLSSPAQRGEIVWGKLLTIMTFSMITSLLNLFSMGLTGVIIIKQLGGGVLGSGLEVGPPPLASVGWLIVALLPISALFSALTLAIAAFARSTKEGQYYLMPLLLITLPLMMLPMLPAVQLDLGTSLIPVTGVMLLLRALIEGQYAVALPYVAPVVGVTLVCCLLAMRWAIDQFNNESVLFAESERWDLKLWLRHLVRDRAETPTAGEAILCGVLLLVINFFASMFVGTASTWNEVASSALIMQVALIATPALMMAIMLTRNRKKTLLIRRTHPAAVPLAMLLAITLHPVVRLVNVAVNWLYPISEAALEAIQPIEKAVASAPPLQVVQLLFVLALVPAVCEELAFRGFILSGLRHLGHKWAAIGLTAVFFGITHVLLQQSLVACVTGAVIGYIAVQSGSIWPCIVYHFTHNSLAVLSGRYGGEISKQLPQLMQWFGAADESGIAIGWQAAFAVVGGLLAAGILLWFHRLPYKPSDEERLQHALDHQTTPVTAK